MCSSIRQQCQRLMSALLPCCCFWSCLHATGNAYDERPADNAIAADVEAKSAEGEQQRVAVELKVNEVRIDNLSALDAIRGQLVLNLTITNSTSAACALNAADFSAVVNKNPTDFNPAVQEPLILGKVELPPGESRTGNVAFNLQYPSSKEPTMELRWRRGDSPIVRDLNAAARQTTKMSTSLVGPQNCLAIIEFHRVVDHLGVWLISEELKRLKRAGIERVILSVHPVGPPPQMYTLRSSIGGWLASVQAGQVIQRVPFASSVQSPIQFERFIVVGISPQTSQSGYFARQSKVFQSNRDRAIADSLKHAYDQVPLKEALQDLTHKEPGVQMMAIEANVDRLTELQLLNIIEQSKERSPEYKILLAKNLFRVPFSSVTANLVELVHNDHADVSEAAIESLVKSVAPKSDEVLNRLWREADEGDPLRESIVVKVLEAKDHRHSRLLTDYAIGHLRRFAEPDAENQEVADETDVSGEVVDEKQTSIATDAIRNKAEHKDAGAGKSKGQISPPAKSLAKVMVFLAAHDDQQLLSVARESLLKIRDPAVQDVVMAHLLKSDGNMDEALAQAYIEQRLPPVATDAENVEGQRLTKEQSKKLSDRLGPSPGSQNRWVTSQVMWSIRKYPAPYYTTRLRKLVETRAVTGNIANDVFRTAVRCADHHQLSEFVDDVDDLSNDQLGFLLGQLSAMNHPQWLEIAQHCLSKDLQVQNVALGVLRSQSSPESIQVVVDFMDELRIKAEEKKTLDRSTLHVVSRVMAHLQTVNYPEARRVLNRCYRSPIEKLSDLADNCLREAARTYFRSSPYQAELGKVLDLRKEKKHKEAIAATTDLLSKDPFYTTLYVSRASLFLRTGSPELAMQDLEAARQQNPEDAVIEMIAAIAMVRLGNVEQGIAEAERFLAQIPDLPTQLRRDAIYNTACVYGRASEVAPNTELQSRHVDKAMKLLTECVERKEGFDDVEHLLDDPDLKMLHKHPDWQAIVEGVRKNEQNKPKA